MREAGRGKNLVRERARGVKICVGKGWIHIWNLLDVASKKS
jgi:hypothetical protein